jgi:uncharacterized RDD family membrane protein YckC
LNSPIDTIVSAETPEGIEIWIRTAGLPARGCAFLIDMMLQGLSVSIFAAVLQIAGGFGQGLLLISVFLIQWFYPVLFELLPGAATPGKRVMGLHVLMANGLPITPAGSLIRNLTRVVDMLPALYAFGILSLLLRGDARRLGDLAAGTVVAYRPSLEHARFAPAVPQAPRVALSERQQRAITAFAARIERLTPERAEEIAALAARVRPSAEPIHHVHGAAPLGPYLVSLARWLHGERKVAS